MVYYGILLNFTEHQVKYWNVKHQQVEFLARPFGSDFLTNGEWYEFHHKNIIPMENQWTTEVLENESQPTIIVDFHERVYAKTLVFPCPMDGTISQEIAVKYRGMVWSPFIGLIRDPVNVWEKGKCEVCAKLVNGSFEVIEYMRRQSPQLLDDARFDPPWKKEMGGLVVPGKEETLEYLASKYITKTVDPRFIFNHSVCLATREVIHPVTECKSIRHFLFNQHFGVIQCHAENLEIGCWYQHRMWDVRNIENHISWETLSIFERCKAIDSIWVDSPLEETEETEIRQNKVRENQVQLNYVIQFPFVHKTLEDAENRVIENWNVRKKGFKKDAHTWNKYLGKVEIYGKEGALIVKLVVSLPEDHQKKPIMVVAVASLHLNYERNFQNYPEMGLFLVTKIVELQNPSGDFIASL